MPIGAGDVAGAWVMDGRIVVALSGPLASEVIALDASDGHLLWRTGI